MPLSQKNSAIVLMITAVLFFSLMDATAKALSQEVGVLTTLWARYAGQSVVVLLLVARHMPGVFKTRYPKLQFIRSLFLLLATACFFTAIANIGLGEAAAIMNVNPVLITLGAAIFLGEGFGWRRMAGVLTALLGALIVIRPGADVFSPYALFAFGGAVFYSAYALSTRFVGKDESVWTSLVYTGLIGAAVLTVLVVPEWQTPSLHGWGLMALLAFFGTCGQLCLIRSLSSGEAGMLAPFAYISLIFASLWGAMFFGEYPDLYTVLGGLVIVSGGIYVWHREARG